MNEIRPLVSVLMTAYNRERFIAEAIESVLGSTYTNFELIILDDCSSDTTLEIAHVYAKRDSRIRVYKNGHNLGDYNNRNQAASYATGKYIKYVDSDDIIYSHGLEVMVKAMEKYPECAVGIVSLYIQEEKPYPFILNPEESYRRHFYEKGIFETGPGGLIFNTEKFMQIGGFSGKRYIGDIEINLRLAAKWPIVKIASSLIFWRQHEQQEYAIGTSSNGYLELLLPMYEEELGKADCPLSGDQRKAIIRYYRKLSARKILNMAFRSREAGLAVKMYKQLAIRPRDIFDATFFIKKRY
ncbi:MAG TPA: glycosyltransferase family 2 protein [Puia sp.]|jgi:glycosyltransferase involved in cell wall biosynthesis